MFTSDGECPCPLLKGHEEALKTGIVVEKGFTRFHEKYPKASSLQQWETKP